MVIVALVALGASSAALLGGRLSALAEIQLRRLPLLFGALALQIAMYNLPVAHSLATAASIVTYAAGAWFLASNLHVPGMALIATGALSNDLAMLVNGGIMPATPTAMAKAGLAASGQGFANSTAVPGARVPFLGDVFAVPHSWPFSNVYSVGDILIAMGVLVAFHKISRSRLRLPDTGEFAVLRTNRNFISLWAAEGVSSVGDWVYTIAVAASIAEHHAQAGVFAGLVICQVGPAALTGILAGPLVDRLPRRGLIVGADVLRATAVASLLVTADPSIAHFYAVAAALGLLGAMAQPAVQASLPNIVPTEHLVAANALTSATFHGAVMVGPVIGGVLVSQLGPRFAFLLNAASFAVAAAVVLRTRIPRHEVAPGRWHPVAELRVGLRYAAASPLVRAVAAVMGMVMLAAAIKSPIEPLFVLRALHGDAHTLGLVAGMWGMGMVAGSVLAPKIVRVWPREKVLQATVALVGVFVIAASQAEALTPLLVLWALAGGGNAIGSVCYESMLQERLPDRVRGRVLAALEAVLDVAFLGGALLSGWLGAHLGARGALVVAGVGFLLAALFARALPLSVADVGIDEADELVTPSEAGDVLADAGGQRGPSHLGRVGAVRGDDAVGQAPQRVPFGQWLRIGDIECGTADDPLLERIDERLGVHVPAARHVDQPGVPLHHLELLAADEALGLGRERQGQDHHVGPPQPVVQPVEANGPCRTCEWLGLPAHDCDVRPQRFEKPYQGLGDAAGADHGDVPVEQGAT